MNYWSEVIILQEEEIMYFHWSVPTLHHHSFLSSDNDLVLLQILSYDEYQHLLSDDVSNSLFVFEEPHDTSNRSDNESNCMDSLLGSMSHTYVVACQLQDSPLRYAE
eukprot:scaffold187331_cov63-Attheya_sp.AAC.2